jgi:hypothetical protein
MNIKAICMGAAFALSAGSVAFAGALDAADNINKQAFHINKQTFHTGPRVHALIDPIQGVDEGITGRRVTALINQVQGVDQGIAVASKVNRINPAKAHRLHMRAAHISQAAKRTAAAGHGTISATQYQQLMHQLDGLSQTLRADTGGANSFGNGGDGGYYPNGYGSNW